MAKKSVQEIVGKLIVLEWQNIFIRFGGDAAKTFFAVYAKHGAETAYAFKNMLVEYEDKYSAGSEELKQLIAKVAEEVA